MPMTNWHSGSLTVPTCSDGDGQGTRTVQQDTKKTDAAGDLREDKALDAN